MGLAAAITPAVPGRAALPAAAELYLGRLFTAEVVDVFNVGANALAGDGLSCFYDYSCFGGDAFSAFFFSM